VGAVLVLLAGARVPARAEEFPPAYVLPRANAISSCPSGWPRPAAPRVTRAALAPLDEDPLAPSPAAVVVGLSALEPADGDGDAVPVFPIQLRMRGRDEMPAGAAGEEGVPSFLIQLQPPGPERLFRRESEAAFQERIRQSTPRRPFEPVIFPQEPVISSSDEPPARTWPPQPRPVEPNYVCYGPLFYQQKYFERYGWDLGVLSPFVSLGTFWYDVLLVPYHLTWEPWCGHECSAGYCLPGDPTPLRLDPPHWPVTFEVNYYRPQDQCEGCAAP
jgi:hypothetical protein